MYGTGVRLDSVSGQHRLEGGDASARCVTCGITVWLRHTSSPAPGPRTWLVWHALDGRTWESFPSRAGWVTYPDRAPSCPPQDVEARCPWEGGARRYGGEWGDVQLGTALRTWCERHEKAVADCPEPGPYCPGWQVHEDGDSGMPGPCTGREDSCQCMCPACCGDTPDMYGYDGDH